MRRINYNCCFQLTRKSFVCNAEAAAGLKIAGTQFTGKGATTITTTATTITPAAAVAAFLAFKEVEFDSNSGRNENSWEVGLDEQWSLKTATL